MFQQLFLEIWDGGLNFSAKSRTEKKTVPHIFKIISVRFKFEFCYLLPVETKLFFDIEFLIFLQTMYRPFQDMMQATK